jgi:hypothetical protein
MYSNQKVACSNTATTGTSLERGLVRQLHRTLQEG